MNKSNILRHEGYSKSMVISKFIERKSFKHQSGHLILSDKTSFGHHLQKPVQILTDTVSATGSNS